MDESVVLHEIDILVAAIKEHGDAQEGGTWTIAFGKVRERECVPGAGGHCTVLPLTMPVAARNHTLRVLCVIRASANTPLSSLFRPFFVPFL